MVECDLAKMEAVGSNPASRSKLSIKFNRTDKIG